MLWPTLGRVALWLVPRRLLVRLWLVRGFCCALRVLDGCFVSPLLDSNPAWLLGPTANRFAHVIVGEVRFLCCPLGFTLLSVGASPPLLWRAGRGLLSFPCLGHVRAALRVVWVGAPLLGCVRGGSLSPVAGP